MTPALYRLAAPIRRRALGLAGWRTLGTRAVVVGVDGRIALVRHSYTGSALYLPGGGVDRGEGFCQALTRELAEEIGVTRFAVDRLLGLYHARGEGRDDHVAVYVVRLDVAQTHAATVTDRREIAALVWVDVDALPADVSPATARRIAEYRSGVIGEGDW